MPLRRLVLALALLLVVPAPAHAAGSTGRCLLSSPSPLCSVWRGRVTSVDDGDTLHVDIKGDGTSRPVRIRITGIQAMEQTVYSSHPRQRRGECHALEATARLEQLVKAGHRRVRLAAVNAHSNSRGRPFRSLAMPLGGRWRDVGAILVAEGQALWMPQATESAWNMRYSELENQAGLRGVGLWNSTYCGDGPSQTARLRMWVNADPDGDDYDFIDGGEWVKIENLDPVNAVPLGHWWVRDSGLRRYTFPASAVLAPGGTITMWVGHGANTPTDFHWRLDTPVFDNIGDGAYLFDPQGDLRLASVYPCRMFCTDPLQGQVEVTAHPTDPEYVLVRNVAAGPIDLYRHHLVTPRHSYAFGPGSVLAPGEAMRIDAEGDPADDTRLEKGWDQEARILPNGGGTASVQTFTGIVAGCDAWGGASC